MDILPVVIAGGTGSRLWPLSRESFPKQFLSLTTDISMLQQTIGRLSKIKHLPPVIVCNQEHRFVVAEQLRAIDKEHGGIILEPFGRNTAPAIALAAFRALSMQYDPIILVMASDHTIGGEDKLNSSIIEGVNHALDNKLVTFGIKPTRAETGFGYIKKGPAINEMSFVVDSFVEKPNKEKAELYLNAGEYYWNSGIFMFKASIYLDELKKFRPDIYNCCEHVITHSHKDLDFIRLNDADFNSCPNESIDYAVLEKTDKKVVVNLDVEWSDIGSWEALWEHSDKDKDGNVLRGDIITENTNNSYVYSQDRLIAVVGVNELVIIETKDAILVADKKATQDVKKIVEQLKRDDRQEYLFHREVYRPWGKHDTIAEGNRYQVKTITVKPGERTATQLHYHRAEHWIVVSGTAKILKGSESIILTENQEIYIPIGIPHALENPGLINLELIEVRIGSYLKEDDVIRIEEYRR